MYSHTSYNSQYSSTHARNSFILFQITNTPVTVVTHRAFAGSNTEYYHITQSLIHYLSKSRPNK